MWICEAQISSLSSYLKALDSIPLGGGRIGEQVWPLISQPEQSTLTTMNYVVEFANLPLISFRVYFQYSSRITF
ncbi:hypothetical protein GCM10010525_29240 [Glutamicibacter bergerei]|uniref:Uncharacterized protein n=1 Tax=Glutamicibacter ardleyensis TaxID=225894 RepID=A0ABQ2DCY6_9MICC|nr:hypothetical protein GCM10007173_07790 [Glutamicibacter ardleyensis]